MLNRSSFITALAFVLPLALVALVLVLTARSAAPTPAVSPGTASGASDTMPLRAPAQPTAIVRPSGPAAPELRGGGAWINSEPLTLADLGSQGKVVLVDFWTYGCYNCRNTLPYIKQWWEKYRDQGLVIVGVHTPEFASEHVLENVQNAVARDGIGWPVVQDNDYAIWQAYGNHYWPHFYLVDERGQIIYDHIGEGAYDETERQIQAALAAARAQ
jgi:thiol-disulfide isomerase/thioredoxin